MMLLAMFSFVGGALYQALAWPRIRTALRRARIAWARFKRERL
jgi:hypothetical protein